MTSKLFKMRTMRNMLAIAITMAVFVSCGKSVLKPQTTKIAGPLGEYFEVVDRTYSLHSENGKEVVYAEIKRVKEGGPKDASWDSSPTFILSLLDSNGDILDTDETDVVLEENELETVFGLREGESSAIPFSFNKKKATQFKVSSKWNVEKEEKSSSVPTSSEYSVLVTGTDVRLRVGPGLNYDPITDAEGKNIHPNKGDRLVFLGSENDFFKVRYAGQEVYISQQFTELVPGSATATGLSSSYVPATSTTTSPSSSASNGSTDWDAVLNSFEKCVDDYIAMMKKAAKGDPTALAKYPSLLKNAKELESKLEDADDDLSPAQLSRYMKILKKMTSAVADIDLGGISSSLEDLEGLLDDFDL